MSNRLHFFGAVLAAVACSSETVGPNVDCSTLVGSLFIELQPQISGTFADYSVNVGDSIQVTGSVRQVTASEPIFDFGRGWTCRATETTPVAGAVTLSTSDTTIVRLNPGGWIRGLTAGFAILGASSSDPPVNRTFAVLVTS